MLVPFVEVRRVDRKRFLMLCLLFIARLAALVNVVEVEVAVVGLTELSMVWRMSLANETLDANVVDDAHSIGEDVDRRAIIVVC